ncbi:hypothetical protein [Tenuifilum osseticum]|uniref:hypothetical protein n=1 Tax=Tenuifilum osseticum TaxID=3374723 RepID=UPI0034E43C2B
MKTNSIKIKYWNTIIIVQLFAMLLISCGQLTKVPDLIGEWKTDKIGVIVRSKSGGNWQFTSDSCTITLIIKDDYTADGKIGLTEFKDGKIKTNWLLPIKLTGQAYKIKCGSIGRIFEDDPLEEKKVELWLGPIKQDSINVDLRYTEGGAQFPMAHSKLKKVKI